MGLGNSTENAEWSLCGSEGSEKVPAKVTYFAGLKSRGEPTQIALAYEGITDIEVELIDMEEWGKRKSEALPYLPYITFTDGTVLLETVDVLKYIANKGGKFVVDEATEDLCKIANSQPIQGADPKANLPDGGVSWGFPPYDEWLPTAIAVLKDYVAKLGDGPFFSGEKPGFGEAFVWHNIDNMFTLAKDDIATELGEEDMAKLQAFYDAFAALDGIKDYLESRPTKFPKFGFPGSKLNPE